GTVMTNRAGIRALGAVFDRQAPMGVRLGPNGVAKAIAGLRDTTPRLAHAISEAFKGRNEVVIVDGSLGLDAAKKLLRHERFHITQALLAFHLGPYTHFLLDHPLTKRHAAQLKSISYPEDQIALEIGADLASGD